MGRPKSGRACAYWLSVRLSETEKQQYDSLIIQHMRVDALSPPSDAETFRMLLNVLAPVGRLESWRTWARPLADHKPRVQHVKTLRKPQDPPTPSPPPEPQQGPKPLTEEQKKKIEFLKAYGMYPDHE